MADIMPGDLISCRRQLILYGFKISDAWSLKEGSLMMVIALPSRPKWWATLKYEVTPGCMVYEMSYSGLVEPG
jgi:hypothetical protein